MDIQVSQYLANRLYDSKILVVDDMTMNRELIISYLEQAGFRNLESAEDGQDAVDKVKTFDPDLIVMDIIMPRMNGIEALQAIRKEKKYAKTPILLQTVVESPEQRSEAWKAGATDILTKPINRMELISRINVQLNNVYQFRELENYHAMAQEDISHALEVQRLLLPPQELLSSLEDRYDVDIRFLFKPSGFLSGDLWGVIDVNYDKLAVWIADFSGKGIRAALNTFRLHTLIQEYRYCADDPCEFIDALNTRLVKLMPAGQFSTFWIGVIDFKRECLDYAAASFTHPIIYQPGHTEYELGDSTGLPLGIKVNEKYPLRTIPFTKGSSIVLYSDLLWEEKALPGISLLEEDIPNMINQLNGQKMTDAIAQQLKMIGEVKLVDDLTLVEVTRRKS